MEVFRHIKLKKEILNVVIKSNRIELNRPKK